MATFVVGPIIDPTFPINLAGMGVTKKMQRLPLPLYTVSRLNCIGTVLVSVIG